MRSSVNDKMENAAIHDNAAKMMGSRVSEQDAADGPVLQQTVSDRVHASSAAAWAFQQRLCWR